MNFLAHMYLSCGDEELIVGNFVADFIKNKDLSFFSEGVRAGVTLHRKIDTFTDRHPVVIASTKLLHERHHKYAPVVIDIFYDYILTKNWKQYSGVTLEDFASQIYEVLMEHNEIFPAKLMKRTPKMVAGRFLEHYGTMEGMQFTFAKMATRAKFKSNFLSAPDDLIKYYDELENGFVEFFPELIAYVESICACD